MAYLRRLQPNEFFAMADDWNHLAGGVPFLRHAWQTAWWTYYGRGATLAILVVEEAGKPVGIAPWYISTSAARGHVIRQIGDGEICSDYLTVLCEPNQEDTVAQCLAEYLVESPDFAWDQLQLAGVDRDDLGTERFIEHLQARQLDIHRQAEHRCWRLNLPATWEEYLATQSRSHRKQLRRLERRVLETDTAQLHLATDEASLATGWEILVELHQRRRNALGQPGCFASEAFTNFHRQVAEDFLQEGRLRLFWLELDGQPAAAEYQIAGEGITYAYQAGVDPERIDAEPGRLITMATLQHAMREGQHGFDFLRGDEPYKPHWRAEPRQTYSYHIAAPHARARLRQRIVLTTVGMKDWLKSGLSAFSGDQA